MWRAFTWIAAIAAFRRLLKPRGAARGLYWDIGPADTLGNIETYTRLLKRYGFTRVCVEVQAEAQSGPFLYWSDGELEKVAKHWRGHGIDVGAMLWPRPTSAYLGALGDLQVRLWNLGCTSLQLDLEGRWAPVNRAGFPTMEAAGDQLVSVVRDFPGVVDVTTYPSKAGELRGILERVNGCSIQAYSQNDPERPGYEWGGAYGPGNMQRLAAEKARGAGAKRVDLALAAYDQRFPEGPDRAMTVAYQTALEEMPGTVWWWSAKWVLGRPGNSPISYVVAWFERFAT